MSLTGYRPFPARIEAQEFKQLTEQARNDGDPNTCFTSNKVRSPWWSVDLGKEWEVVAVHIKLGGCVHLYSVYSAYSDAVYSVNLTISSVASQSAGVCQALHEIFQYKSHLNMNWLIIMKKLLFCELN